MENNDVFPFVDLAKKYCLLIEQINNPPIINFKQELLHLLPNLYSRCLLLPDVEPTERITINVERIKHNFSFDEYECYLQIFDPYNIDHNEPVYGSLSDDIMDIYYDLKRGLLLFESGNQDDIDDAIWDWKFHFQIHWGTHLIDALKALHSIQK